MKSLNLTLALCALAVAGNAQPLTGQSYYGHNGINAILSSGTYVNANAGFIMGGYLPTSSGTQPNFLIDKVDPNGSFVSGTGFSNQYTLFDAGTTCTTSCLNMETRCYGVSVIENPNSSCSNMAYALSGLFDAGILFATLDNTGAVISSALYTIPAGAVPYYRPLITRAASGDYYLAGSYFLTNRDYMYAMKVNPNGNVSWSFAFDLTTASTTLQARGIVEDRYPGFDELAIAGTFGGAVSTDGFLITLNGATGAPIIRQALASGQTVNDNVSSIALAAGNGGYILGGSSFMTPGPNRAWMMRLNANATFNWSSRLQPSTNISAGEVIGVAERFSTAYNAYEYYGLTVSTGTPGGMMVLKLNQTGNLFSQPGNLNNEFVYNDGSGNIALPASISQLDAGTGGNNTGIHVFGTTQNSPARFFLDQACFNGATGNCLSTSQQNLTVIKTKVTGPLTTYTFSPTVNNGPAKCSNYFIKRSVLSYTPTQPCSMTSMPAAPYTGSNNRQIAPGAGGNNSGNGNILSVYPNPTNNNTEISYTSEGGEVTITLSDILGKQIKTLENSYKDAGENSLQVDLNSLNLQTGVYFITVTTNGTSNQQKIIYNRP